jgi:hypothetical protein
MAAPEVDHKCMSCLSPAGEEGFAYLLLRMNDEMTRQICNAKSHVSAKMGVDSPRSDDCILSEVGQRRWCPARLDRNSEKCVHGTYTVGGLSRAGC